MIITILIQLIAFRLSSFVAKLVPNYAKIDPQWCPKSLKIGPKFTKHRSVELDTSKKCEKFDFFNFGLNFRVPKWTPNRISFMKKALKKASCFRLQFFN